MAAAYIAAAPLLDVMVEQLEYLVTHESPECPTGWCPDCRRSAHIQALLLEPFAHPVVKPKSSAAAGGK